jgi:hypothetical protein
MGNRRLERALLGIGRTAPLHTDMGLGGEVLVEHLHQSGFANAGLPTEHDDLSQPVSCLGPARLQQRQFRLPPDQGCQPTRGPHLQATLHLTRAQHLVRRHRHLYVRKGL